MRHTRSSILYHALLLTGVNFLLRGVSMLFQIYLSNRVGAAGVGLMQLIFTVEAAAMTFGLSGARVAAMYLCAEEYGRRHLPCVFACAMARFAACWPQPCSFLPPPELHPIGCITRMQSVRCGWWRLVCR